MAVDEAEWAIEVMKATGKPVAATVTITVDKDLNGVSTEECALRLARSGEIVTMIFCRDNWQQADRQTDRRQTALSYDGSFLQYNTKIKQ